MLTYRPPQHPRPQHADPLRPSFAVAQTSRTSSVRIRRTLRRPRVPEAFMRTVSILLHARHRRRFRTRHRHHYPCAIISNARALSTLRSHKSTCCRGCTSDGLGGRRISADQPITERIETASTASLVSPTGSIRASVGVEIVAGAREISGGTFGAR
jgi:hypothetical protein